MICAACRERRHAECRGGSWCDCQHLPPVTDAKTSEEKRQNREPGVNWLRQG